MRRVLSLLAAAVLAMTVTTPAAMAATVKKPSSTALERVQAYVAPSIVNLQISWSAYVWDAHNRMFLKDISSGQLQQFKLTFQCTGWVVNPDGYVATAGHCVNPDQVREDFYQTAATWAAQCACYYGDTTLTADQIMGFSTDWTLKHYDGNSARVKNDASRDAIQAAWPVSAGGVDVGKAMPARVIKFQSFDAGDAALLKVDAEGLPALPMITGDPTIGSHVVAIGFPGSVDQVTDPDLEPSYKDGSLGSQSTEGGGLTTVYEISAATSGGMSGGPVVNDEGEVMGFVDFKSATETQAFNFMRPVSALSELFVPGAGNELDTNAKTYHAGLKAYFDGDKVTAVKDLNKVVAAQPTNKYATQYLAKAKLLPDPPKSHTGLFVMIGVAVVVLIAIIVLGLLLLLRRRGKSRSGPTTPMTGGMGGMGGPGGPAAVAAPVTPVALGGPAAPVPVAPATPANGVPAGFGGPPTPSAPAAPVAPAAPQPPGVPNMPTVVRPPGGAVAPPAGQPAQPVAPSQSAVCGRCGAARVPGQHFCGSCGTAY